MPVSGQVVDARPLILRRLTRDDAEAVRELDSLILGRDRSVTWAEYMERFLAFSRLSSQSLPWAGSQVAEIGGKVVGFLLAERQSSGYGLPPGTRIVAVAVRPGHRLAGIGRKLVEALIEDCRRQGVKHVYSVLQDHDQRDSDFLSACGLSPAPVRVFARKV